MSALAKQFILLWFTCTWEIFKVVIKILLMTIMAMFIVLTAFFMLGLISGHPEPHQVLFYTANIADVTFLTLGR
jgi:hypothetical protein